MFQGWETNPQLHVGLLVANPKSSAIQPKDETDKEGASELSRDTLSLHRSKRNCRTFRPNLVSTR